MSDSLSTLLSLIDLTSLNENDTEASITTLCKQALTPFGHVAAVCVYPQFIACVNEALGHTSVNRAAVANFPHGNDSLEQVTATIQDAIQHGANEIDVVFPFNRYLQGEKKAAIDFVQQCKIVCGKEVLLKVILETGVLKEPRVITEVSRDVLLAGANFLKTSTGKTAIGATLEAATSMLLAIKEFQASHPIGFKASGGIRSIEQAEDYVKLAHHLMGADWVSPKTFRIGASQLVGLILEKLKHS